jgi:hypothetical protein
VAAAGQVFTTVGDRLYVFDPVTMQVTKTVRLPGAQLEISLGRLPTGPLVGLTTKGVYVYDPRRGEIVHTAEAPVTVGCGFALLGDEVYFGAHTELWRYRLPPLDSAPGAGPAER